MVKGAERCERPTDTSCFKPPSPLLAAQTTYIDRNLCLARLSYIPIYQRERQKPEHASSVAFHPFNRPSSVAPGGVCLYAVSGERRNEITVPAPSNVQLRVILKFSNDRFEIQAGADHHRGSQVGDSTVLPGQQSTRWVLNVSPLG